MLNTCGSPDPTQADVSRAAPGDGPGTGIGVPSVGRSPHAMRTPGWIGEGIPDYIRWFLYEPQTRGAEISARALPQARYDASYRTSANFINWVTNTYDKDLPRKVNAAAREGRYMDEIWKELTGKTVQELGEEWKKAIGERLAANAAAPAAGN